MKLYMAPLHGVTNRVFRKVWFRHFGGIDAVLAPFILAVGANGPEGKHFKDLVPGPTSGPEAGPDAPSVPLVPQLLAGDAKAFLATAAIIADLGYTEINWNLGCPHPMVAKKGRGSGLLPHPDRIRSFLDEVCPRLSERGMALSVKMRLGRNNPDEILTLMPILNDHPLAYIIIHPRVGTQMYRGGVNFDAFERALGLSGHPVVYNGDIRDRAHFMVLERRFADVDAWMIGRGAVADPFLPARIKGLDPPADPLAGIKAFHDELYAAYRETLCGPAHPLDKMKEVWSYLGPSINAPYAAFNAIASAKAPADYDRAVATVFSEGRWKDPR